MSYVRYSPNFLSLDAALLSVCISLRSMRDMWRYMKVTSAFVCLTLFLIPHICKLPLLVASHQVSICENSGNHLSNVSYKQREYFVKEYCLPVHFFFCPSTHFCYLVWFSRLSYECLAFLMNAELISSHCLGVFWLAEVMLLLLLWDYWFNLPTFRLSARYLGGLLGLYDSWFEPFWKASLSFILLLCLGDV